MYTPMSQSSHYFSQISHSRFYYCSDREYMLEEFISMEVEKLGKTEDQEIPFEADMLSSPGHLQFHAPHSIR